MTVQSVQDTAHKSFFSSSELAQIIPSRVPKHVAIIMDGNRRWAQQKEVPPVMGHWQGAESLTDIVRASVDLGIKTLTVFAFSTENWHRPGDEVESLMDVFELYLHRKREFMVREGVRLNAIGDLAHLPSRVLNAFQETKMATEHCDRIQLVLALNYGARDEIRRAIVRMLHDGISAVQVTESLISQYLDTSNLGDPELLIRTSGEMRVSNFLLWQISYAEIFSTDVHWPDFQPKDLLEAVLAFQQRGRRWGQ